jgi:uncharacterized LabA/DUF88 family protein
MRVAFIIDGFNVYHSIREAEKHVPARPQRWLDLTSLCSSYLFHFGRTATLQGVYYFSAFAKHLTESNHGIVGRHQDYVEALKSTGVHVGLANFKARDKYVPLRFCRFKIGRLKRLFRIPLPGCRLVYVKAEEKETDVAIASKMFELLHTGAADGIVLVSGDTDLLPAIRTCRKLFPQVTIAVLFPYGRHNAELRGAVTKHIKIGREQYAKHQFPPQVTSGGRVIHRPKTW